MVGPRRRIGAALAIVGMPGTPQREDLHPLASDTALLDAVRRSKEPRTMTRYVLDPWLDAPLQAGYRMQCANGQCSMVRVRR